jgi:hypothetical protein
MLDRQLLQTHFVYKFFLALKGKKERVFFSHFSFCKSCKFLLENPFYTGKNTISEFLFAEIYYQQTTFTRQKQMGMDIRSFPSNSLCQTLQSQPMLFFGQFCGIPKCGDPVQEDLAKFGLQETYKIEFF